MKEFELSHVSEMVYQIAINSTQATTTQLSCHVQNFVAESFYQNLEIGPASI